MNPEDFGWRRKLARELTERVRAPAAGIGSTSLSFGSRTRRVGITGPPGAGKSSLIAMLAKEWMALARRVGVIAIDPTSPVSGGALLGDRIRMDDVAQNPKLFIRSLSSGSAHDGLCPNISSLLDACEQVEFDYLVLETVGVGQVNYEARSLVDTLVLVLVPGSGDTVQAMKAGVLEVADIYVINKADQPTADKLASELRSIAGWRGKHDGWVPPVILTSATERRGASELAEAIEGHRNAVLNPQRIQALISARREYHLRSLLLQQIDDICVCHRTTLQEIPLADGLRLIIDRLRSD